MSEEVQWRVVWFPPDAPIERKEQGMSKRVVTYELEAEVTFDIADGVDLTHWIDPDTGERIHRMNNIYPDIVTEDDVLGHLAYNAIFNGVTDASRLDGWADLGPGKITIARVDGGLVS